MEKTNCPWLKECFIESLRRKHFFIDENKCTHRVDWTKCSVYLGRNEVNVLKETLEEMLEMKETHGEENNRLGK